MPSTDEDKCRRIRNLIRKYDPIEMALALSHRVRWIEQDLGQWDKWNPYHLLLLIRWGIEHGGSHYPPKPFTDAAFVKLYNLVNDLGGSTLLPDDGPGSLNRFMRTMAYQQFWFQTTLGRHDVGRQLFLFADLEENHTIRVRFREQHGFDVPEFLELSFIMSSWLAKNHDLLFKPAEYFAQATYGPGLITSFLSTTSLTPNEATAFLRQKERGPRQLDLQAYEQFPLVGRPLLELPQGYLAYSRNVFVSFLRYYLYDTVKSDADTSLSEKLAKCFERYVESCLEYMGKDFLTESQLRERLGRGKVTDFLIPDGNSNILVEVKAVELAPLVQVRPFSKYMIQRLKGNVVKGVVQGYTMVERLEQAREQLGLPLGPKYFLLVVTFRDLNLGTGKEAWEEFLKAAVEAKFSNPDTRKLPPENIFVLSITELEQIIATCASAGLALVDYFARAASRNAQIGKGRYYTVMHFDEEERKKAEPIPFLWKRFEEWADRITAKVGGGAAGKRST